MGVKYCDSNVCDSFKSLIASLERIQSYLGFNKEQFCKFNFFMRMMFVIGFVVAPNLSLAGFYNTGYIEVLMSSLCVRFRAHQRTISQIYPSVLSTLIIYQSQENSKMVKKYKILLRHHRLFPKGFSDIKINAIKLIYNNLNNMRFIRRWMFGEEEISLVLPFQEVPRSPLTSALLRS